MKPELFKEGFERILKQNEQEVRDALSSGKIEQLLAVIFEEKEQKHLEVQIKQSSPAMANETHLQQLKDENMRLENETMRLKDETMRLKVENMRLEVEFRK